MEKKNVNVLLPTIEQLQTMESILNRARLNGENGVFEYAFAKMVEWTIANGGLENFSTNEFPEEIAYLISRSTSLIYPDEQAYLDLPDVRIQDIYNAVLAREVIIDPKQPSRLDSLIPQKRNDLKKDYYYLEKVIRAVDKELYRNAENRFVIPNNVGYRFDHMHDAIVSALFEGRIFDLFNYTPSETIIELCAKIEPLYILKCKAEDLADYHYRWNLDYVNNRQACCLRNAVKDFASLYSITSMSHYGMGSLSSEKNLSDKSNAYCKSITGFFGEHGGRN